MNWSTDPAALERREAGERRSARYDERLERFGEYEPKQKPVSESEGDDDNNDGKS